MNQAAILLWKNLEKILDTNLAISQMDIILKSAQAIVQCTDSVAWGTWVWYYQ